MARKPTYDYDLTKDVRNQALVDILEVLKETPKSKKFGSYKQQMLLKLANTVLPRVNEITGKDGQPVQALVKFIDAKDSNNTDTD